MLVRIISALALARAVFDAGEVLRHEVMVWCRGAVLLSPQDQTGGCFGCVGIQFDPACARVGLRIRSLDSQPAVFEVQGTDAGFLYFSAAESRVSGEHRAVECGLPILAFARNFRQVPQLLSRQCLTYVAGLGFERSVLL
jgi:hypothetical protein